MRINRDQMLLSATDLANHLACRHLTNLDLRLARGEVEAPDWSNPWTAVLHELGLEHEQAYLDHLKLQGYKIADLTSESTDSTSSFQQTAEAMRAGFDVIYQPVLMMDHWRGRADVLLRSKNPSPELGDWSYEAVDCKLARDTRAGAILQLALYSQCIEAVQGVWPERMYVVAPGTGFALTPFQTADYLAYYRSVVARLLNAVVSPSNETYPEPTPHCDVCRWSIPCERQRRADDHPCFVAGISRLQMQQLRDWNITTLRDLSTMPLELPGRPRRGSANGYVRIREQARVQAEARQSGTPVFEVLPCEAGRGLARLPQPSPGDMFLDLEGDPFAGETGLEYLFGLLSCNHGREPSYDRRWAFRPAEEKAAFEWVVDKITARLRRLPDSHVYHFGHYEPSALKRLMGRYATREDEVDRMLRGEVFVDLHSVVRQSVRAGIEQYSLKELEPFHGFHRQTPLKEASSAKRALERALELSAPNKIGTDAQRIVESYNRDDCVSALRLRDWLERLRTKALDDGHSIPRPVFGSPEPSESLDLRQQQVQAVAAELTANIPADPSERSEGQQAKWLLAHLLDYHRRELKASVWEYFRLLDLEYEAYLDEKHALAGLTTPVHVGGTPDRPIYRYSFPPQETDVRAKDHLVFRNDLPDGRKDGIRFGTVKSIDLNRFTIEIGKDPAAKDLNPGAVFVDPRFYVRRDPRPGALLDLGRSVAQHGVDGLGPYMAARSLLMRRAPQLSEGFLCKRVIEGSNLPLDAATKISLLLSDSVFPIQGPPGAGKTYTAARIVCELVRSGRRVGVTALVHKAIAKLLKDCLDAAKEEGLDLKCIRKVTDLDEGSPPDIVQTQNNNEPLRALESGQAHLVAGTTWLWARPEYESAVDLLLVDEASQVPLADVLAVSRAAKSLVLLGDPAQLDQPQQGSHPDGVAVSALQHLLGEHQTLASDRGLFLPQTYRLHPDICKFTSEVFYEGRLKSQPGLDRQKLLGDTPFAGSGLWFVPTRHVGNQNSSREEVGEVDRIVRSLIDAGVEWVDSHGEKHRLTLDDILVVAPYNVQVSDLLARLPQGARVGTVDKFQGQQAPVVIYSMTTSSPEDAPRGMEFLYSLNRLNVATSRARCASILVANERLLEPECRTPRHMKLANALCRYVELAQEVRPGDDRRLAAVGAGAP